MRHKIVRVQCTAWCLEYNGMRLTWVSQSSPMKKKFTRASKMSLSFPSWKTSCNVVQTNDKHVAVMATLARKNGDYDLTYPP